MPRCLDTDLPWEMLDFEAGHLRAHDLHASMLKKIAALEVQDLQQPGAPQTAHGKSSVRETRRYAKDSHGNDLPRSSRCSCLAQDRRECN
ncbi:unnamed protein product [Parnassius apollo]|uniref:(apollo) hypothetical protein n=1 Tax=Parnassius apollo TaxID=110799 RepID=A0A8S3W2A1_PARAO|nr:unnamed protein product [Parnassius apollo]